MLRAVQQYRAREPVLLPSYLLAIVAPLLSCYGRRLGLIRSAIAVFTSVLPVLIVIAASWSVSLHQYDRVCGHHVHRDAPVRLLLVADPQIEGHDRVASQGAYGAFNVAFNDAYMRWIISHAVSRQDPTHVVVLGDLFSRQDIDSVEFMRRARRINSIFQAVAQAGLPMLNVTGNHDVGYPFDITQERINRWESYFGPANTFTELSALQPPAHLAVFNSMVLDHGPDRIGPMRQRAMHIISKAGSKPDVVLATHVPLFKPAGSCPGDVPDIRVTHAGWVKEQTVLSKDVSERILGTAAPLAVVNGHDHVGCRYQHPGSDAQAIPEYTVRSLMAEFAGNIAMLSLRRDASTGRVVQEYTPCAFRSHLQLIPYLTLLGTVVVCCGVWLVIQPFYPHRFIPWLRRARIVGTEIPLADDSFWPPKRD